MYEIPCSDPVLIINPRLNELALQCDYYFFDGILHYIDSDMKFRIACGDSAASVLHIPYAKVIRHKSGYIDEIFREFLDRCSLVESGHKFNSVYNEETGEFDDASYFDGPGACYPIYQWVPCGHCSVCRSRKMSSYVQRARFAVEESRCVGYSCTLKYNDEHLPKDGVLDRRDVQLFMKRLKMSVSRMYKFYSSSSVSFSDKEYCRKVAQNIKIIYSGEYGDQTHRPHWHILLFGLPYFPTTLGFCNSAFDDIMRQKVVQYAWRVSTPDLLGQHMSFVEYRNKYPRAYKTPAGYDPDSIGHIWMKQIDSDGATRYALKYAMKGINKDGSKSIYGSSCNLGVKFVKSHIDEVVSSVDCKFKYKSVVDGRVCSCSLSSYYLSKLFPSYSKLVPSAVRKAFVDFVVSCHYLLHFRRFLLPHIIREIGDRLSSVCDRFSFLNFDFRNVVGLRNSEKIHSFWAYTVKEDSDLDFLVPVYVRSAQFLVAVFNEYESSYKILSESVIDYDEVCRLIARRDEFFSKFVARTRSSILLQGADFEYEMADLVAKSVL